MKARREERGRPFTVLYRWNRRRRTGEGRLSSRRPSREQVVDQETLHLQEVESQARLVTRVGANSR